MLSVIIALLGTNAVVAFLVGRWASEKGYKTGAFVSCNLYTINLMKVLNECKLETKEEVLQKMADFLADNKMVS